MSNAQDQFETAPAQGAESARQNSQGHRGISTGPVGDLRRLIATNVRASVGGGPEDLDDYRLPLGDRGLFGPESMAWRVHADLASMLFGGFSALMLQTLHPLAMAGVAAHSNFREDPTGRLRRTARFVAGTTFGPRPFVERLFGEVRSVHARVVGVAPDGRPYSAADPKLLTWVHVTEAMSFLASYQRYGPRPLLRLEKDRYFAETAEVAYALGAEEVPSSLDAARAYLREIRPELAATEEAFETVHFVSGAPEGPLVGALAHRVVVEAAIDLLPPFAKVELKVATGSRLASGPRRAAAHSLARTLRWALGPSLVFQASLDRVGAS